MKETLKKLLKPPFKWRHHFAEDDAGHYLFGDIEEEYGDEVAGELRNFVIEAMNEKAEREWREPPRWIFEYNEEDGEYWFTCPECKKTDIYSDDEDPPNMKGQRYCPYCGKRINPPEGE